jgi:hypothetical protein
MFCNNIIMTMIIIYCDAVSVWTGGRRGRPKRKDTFPLKGSGLLRLSRAFSPTPTGRLGMGTEESCGRY